MFSIITGVSTPNTSPANQNMLVRAPRKLEESKPVETSASCPLCIPEQELAEFFIGFVSGQARLSDDTDTSMDIGKCIKDANAYKAAYQGGLQSALTEVSFAVQHDQADQVRAGLLKIYDIFDKSIGKTGPCKSLFLPTEANLESMFRVVDTPAGNEVVFTN